MEARHCLSWHETDMTKYLGDVRCWVNSGKHMLASSFSEFDPEQALSEEGSRTGVMMILITSR